LANGDQLTDLKQYNMQLLILLCLVLPAMGRQISSFVVGGSDTTIGQWPHQLSLRVTGSHSCGASLISSTRAVCAAHCAGSALAAYSLLGGTTDRTVTNCLTCELWNPTAFDRHPDFVNNGNQGFPNDVSVLSFNAISTNANLQPITVAPASAGDFAGDRCTITGWGKTSAISGLPAILQRADMTVMTNAACTLQWSAQQINDGHICVTSASSSACNGDSGGPLVCGGLLAGATSWGVSNCSPSYPSVYTRLSYFYAWIMAQ
jgi:secreted trypsin-like serine protease